MERGLFASFFFFCWASTRLEPIDFFFIEETLYFYIYYYSNRATSSDRPPWLQHHFFFFFSNLLMMTGRPVRTHAHTIDQSASASSGSRGVHPVSSACFAPMVTSSGHSRPSSNGIPNKSNGASSSPIGVVVVVVVVVYNNNNHNNWMEDI